MERLHMRIKQSPCSEVLLQTFLSYLYTLPSEYSSTEKALESLNIAEQSCRDKQPTVERALESLTVSEHKVEHDEDEETLIDCDFVCRANKLHILYDLKGKKFTDDLDKLIIEWEQRESNPTMEAAVWGCKGTALSRLGNPQYDEGIMCFTEAIRLDEHNAYWFYGKALLMGRLRRERQGHKHRPSLEEYNLWKYATELSSNPVYMSNIAYSVAEFVKGTPYNASTDAKIEESITFATKALKHAGNNHEIYRQCAKVYKWV